MTAVPTQMIRLSNATNGTVEIPQLGFGTYKVPPAEAERVVSEALEVGYRHIDTAQMYANEAGVGRAIAASGIDRDDLFITSKLNNGNHARDKALRSFDQTLEDLRLERLDLFLVHWPMAVATNLVETWQAMIEILQSGRVRAIGVSNYQADHLRTITDATGIAPAVNQVEISPYLTQEPLRALHAQMGIATEAWSPLARGKVADDPAIKAIGDELGRSASQVVLRWHLQRGDIVFPKSMHRERMVENAQLFDFTLSPAQMDAISALNRDERQGSHPDEVQWTKQP
ncbi:aldo/keto reductase [Propionibacterium australiense]|uniref:Aldo-keto reductase signature n=1 Tax=Propionibacterium australiense TaxID=119981 RepID=A0A383S9U7_9ACTN|nr:aldo/keto reductase [Propionibacterium australiense]RLP06232.1 aldo/keto reductase [Propionibacterium australiense]RLP07570.1 aldo/keto reductase [Propionibacterium australiense]SYZ34573.1 Aldo-keto reductase signature [Propionibacterium australiense]VEH92695.1 Uncharacterized oxidoreductase MSMEG_2408 [Propionibacterium australiense]